jgi:hypothetical protein
MDVDRVLLAAPRGFCAGVEMAIKALAWMVRAFEPPVYCYHEIVHNQMVVQRFEDLGVVFVDDIAEVPRGRPLMLSSHNHTIFQWCRSALSSCHRLCYLPPMPHHMLQPQLLLLCPLFRWSHLCQRPYHL